MIASEFSRFAEQVAEYSAGLITTNALCLWPLF